MRAADAYTQPSIYEGLPNATMEAMATALPVIATDTGGQRELIQSGERPPCPVEPGGALRSLRRHRRQSRTCARDGNSCARNRVIRRFSPAVQVVVLAKLLAEAACAHAPGVRRR